MKQLLIALNIVLLVLVGVLFYLHFDSKNKTTQSAASTPAKITSAAPLRIAYFEMDSVQASYTYFKDVLSELKTKENAMTSELAGMERMYQQKVSAWQQKGPTMSQTEANAAQRENAQMQQNYQARKQTLEEGYTRQSMEYKKNIKEKIEDYLQEFNKDKKYSYVFSYEPELIYYRDTAMNITKELITGLNATYKKK